MIGCDVGSQGTNSALYAATGPWSPRPISLRPVVPVSGAADRTRICGAAVAAGVRELLDELPEGPSAVKGLSFGSQLDGMVVCDETLDPCGPP